MVDTDSTKGVMQCVCFLKINQAGNRKVQYDVFEVKEKGDLALLTSPDNDDEVTLGPGWGDR